ncbi:MAG: esterase-like activity of phytase family protein [Gammaproteobacteria bacterium]
MTIRLLPLLAAALGYIFLPGSVNAIEVARPLDFSQAHPPGSRFMQVRLLGAVLLASEPVDGFGLRQLSGLAWDADAGLLYALSDDGYIAHLKPRFDNGLLAGVEYRAAFALREADGNPVEGKAADSEALALRRREDGNGNELLVSFEQRPRFVRFTPTGQWLGEVAIPRQYTIAANYRSTNDSLESVAVDPRHGIVLAPEQRLRDDPGPTIPIFTPDGRQWRYTPIDPDHSAIVDMAPASDGALLVLERRYKSMFSPIIFAVRRLRLDAEPGSTPPVEEIVRFDNGSDFRIDNFEGIARQEGNRYFMVSDDNRSAIQRTILVCFEIVGPRH